jgi:hypothetical protein
MVIHNCHPKDILYLDENGNLKPIIYISYKYENIFIRGNNLTELSKINDFLNLHTLNCSFNDLTYIPELPINLNTLECSFTPLHTMLES